MAEYRALLTRRGLEHLAAVEPAALARARARLAPELLASVERATEGQWIPVADHVAVIDAERAELGDERFRSFCRELTTQFLSLPFLEPLLTGLVQPLGVTPEALLRYTGRGWQTLFRACGALRYETLAGMPNCGVLVLSGVPPELLASGSLELALVGGFLAYFDLCKTEGEVDVAEEPGELRFIFRWK